MVGITLSAILSFLGCLFLLKSENKSFTPKIIVKKEEYKSELLVTFLGVIGITFLGNVALSIVLIICYLAITKDFKKSILVKESKEISISTFFLNTSTFIKFWPIIFMASLFSSHIFSEYAAQDVVTSLKKSSAVKQAGIIISALIFAPLVEEIIFRRFFYKALKYRFGILVSATFSSMIFAFIHFNVSSFFVLFLVGVFLCYSYEKYGTILAPILFHIVFNLVMILLILSE